MELLHPQANAKPKEFVVEVVRQGGSLFARCGCGHQCNHNHKSADQANLCVERHVKAIQGG
jgi:hypothetical protein